MTNGTYEAYGDFECGRCGALTDEVFGSKLSLCQRCYDEEVEARALRHLRYERFRKELMNRVVSNDVNLTCENCGAETDEGFGPAGALCEECDE